MPLSLKAARQLSLAMNERRRGAANNRVHSHESSQCFGAIALLFCAFLVWLWLYSPGFTDDSHTPSFASVQVRDWLDSSGLQVLKKIQNLQVRNVYFPQIKFQRRITVLASGRSSKQILPAMKISVHVCTLFTWVFSSVSVLHILV